MQYEAGDRFALAIRSGCVESVFSETWVIARVDLALGSGDRDTVLALANTSDAADNQGPPLG